MGSWPGQGGAPGVGPSFGIKRHLSVVVPPSHALPTPPAPPWLWGGHCMDSAPSVNSLSLVPGSRPSQGPPGPCTVLDAPLWRWWPVPGLGAALAWPRHGAGARAAWLPALPLLFSSAAKQAVGMSWRPGASTATGSDGRKRYKRPSYLTGFI